MKRNLLIFAAAAMVLGVVACQKENLVEENEIVSSGKTLDEIKVLMNPETRVSVAESATESKHTVLFEQNDTIFGWDSSIRYAYKCTNISGNLATFTLITEDAPSAAQGTKINLVYAPGKSINDITTGSSLTIDLSSQDCSALDKLPIIMSATGEVDGDGKCSLIFNNNIAIISVYNASFPGAANGSYTVSFDAPNTKLEFSLDGDVLKATSSNASKITSTSQISVTSEKASFFFAVPACSSTNNFKITLGANHTFDTGKKSITAGNYINLNDKNFVNGLYYPGTSLPPIQVGNLLWAPVNCGGINLGDTGLLYQWGRGYGQIYDPDQYDDTDQEANYLIAAKQALDFDSPTNSSKFIYGQDDWCSPSLSAWTHNPCPTGWRVPSATELQTLFSSKSWTASGLVQFPNAGVNSVDGNGSYQGSEGYYWSSDIDNTGSRYMHIDDENDIRMKGDSDNGKRARGMSVRCVKDVN